ncbi:MAG: branched-chain amino acid ABC transporter substrate-binding protein [Rhodobacteraceae bacterium]|jgi:branched-chain amino acid transport system substrate-binding protein|uniref:branched-chain amino acid ABC transporter substrate-binding protein n=1 Tax=Thioclava TaxID=285107 RepID=UPI000998DDA8|nr:MULTISPECIES: branched-chain amino acid ABC transporter substrate-binding protein [Thioclava]TNE92978.1 MAG: branched-chain amino acid ABC transporter substrate-binding protein [Paracoccaceae bacterium]TNF15780.1 MAG: branched-chain amino acid ABC transporter substrate-binding protein [Paracoccaceae bacterium]
MKFNTGNGLRRIVFTLGATAGLLVATGAQAKDTVELGFIGPLTGGVSSMGLGGRNSAELAVKLRNADPDSKYHYELVALDDECKPNVGVQVATKMATDRKVIGTIAHYCSAVAMGTVDVYHRFGLPMTVWGAVLPDITYGNDYPEITRVNGTMINQNEKAAQFMTGLGYKTFAIIHDTTDYGKGHNKYLSQFLAQDGAEVVGTFGVTSDQQDFTAELTQVKALNPDVVVYAGLTPGGVRVRQQMEKLGIEAVFEGVSGIKSDAFFEGLGGDLAEGTVTFLEGAPAEKLPGGAYFLKEYNAAGYDSPPEAYGPFAFAAMDLLIDAVEASGPDRKAVVDYMSKVKEHDSITGPITFDDHGQNTVALITAYVAQGGKWVVWEDSDYAKGTLSLVAPK